MNRIDLTGRAFGSWTVLAYEGTVVRPTGTKSCRWTCRCGCGRVASVDGGHLRSGASTRCRDCRLAAQTIPEERRVCRYCGERTEPKRPQDPVRVCGTCARQRLRRGLCECGQFPLYRTGPKKRCRRCGRDNSKDPHLDEQPASPVP